MSAMGLFGLAEAKQSLWLRLSAKNDYLVRREIPFTRTLGTLLSSQFFFRSFQSKFVELGDKVIIALSKLKN